MIRIAMIAAAAMTWACAAQPGAPAGPSAPGASREAAAEDACGMARFTHLIGQPEGAIPRDQLPAGARVICAACMVTQDFRADRLNFHLGADGRVGSMRCG